MNAFASLVLRLRAARQSAFIANTGKLFAYTIAGLTITLCTTPLLSRLFSPADFGAFGIFIMFAVTSSGLTALSYDAAIPAPTEEQDAATLTFGAIAVAIIVCPALSIIYALLVRFGVLGFGVLPLWSAGLLCLLLFGIASASILQFWCIRQQKFSHVGQGAVTMNLARAITQVGIGIVSGSWIILVLGEIMGRTNNALYLAYRSGHSLLSFRHKMNPRIIWIALKHYRRMALVLMPAMAIDAFVGALVVPAMTSLFGIAIAGQYFLMRRVMDLPMVIMTRTIADAFYGKISEYARTQPDRIRPFMLQVFILGLVLTSICFLPLILFGPSIFAFIFGEKWRIAGLLAAIMSPAVVASLGAAPVTRVFYLTKRPNLRYIFSGIIAVGTVAVFATSYFKQFDLVTTTANLSAVTFVAYMSYFVTAYIASARIHTEAVIDTTG